MVVVRRLGCVVGAANRYGVEGEGGREREKDREKSVAFDLSGQEEVLKV